MKSSKNNISIFSIFIILAILLNSCDMSTRSKPEPDINNSGDLIFFENAVYDIRIKYPNTWYIYKDTKNLRVSFFPVNKYSKNNVTINILDRSTYDKSGNLEERIEKSYQQSNTIKMNKENITLGGNPATKTTITIDHTLHLEDDSFLYFFVTILFPFLDKTELDGYIEKIIHITTIKNNKVYIITYYTKDIKLFNTYIDTANKMFDSFEFTN
jgi:hypothetical protein